MKSAVPGWECRRRGSCQTILPKSSGVFDSATPHLAHSAVLSAHAMSAMLQLAVVAIVAYFTLKTVHAGVKKFKHNARVMR